MNDELIAEALLGEEAEKFLVSDLGRCLIGMAQQDVKEAEEGLKLVDPEDKKLIVALQNKAWLGGNFEAYIRELISKGRIATTIYAQQKQEGA